jgi:hypothetical protein
MTAALIIIPGVCYAIASVMYGKQGNWGLAIVYSGYAWANWGLFIVDRALTK